MEITDTLDIISLIAVAINKIGVIVKLYACEYKRIHLIIINHSLAKHRTELKPVATQIHRYFIEPLEGWDNIHFLFIYFILLLGYRAPRSHDSI